MKCKVFLGLPVFTIFFCSLASAQSYIGHTTGNYSGINAVILNPASVVDSRFKTDINLLSISSLAGSDYLSLDLGAALRSEDGFDFEESMIGSAKDNNQFFLNLDILGPSFMFNLNPKSSIGITTRVRAFMNLNNINGHLYEELESGFDTKEDFDFEMNNFSGTIHAWGELGLTYGRVLINKKRSFLKAGLTLKYLQGAGSLFIHSPTVSGQYTADTEQLVTTGSLSYGNTPGFDIEDPDFENLSAGFGSDLGLTYEYRPDQSPEDDKIYSQYKFKIGVSVTDIGSISYSESLVTNYNLNNSIDVSNFDEKGTETTLDEDYDGTEESVDQKINLPTALHVTADYSLTNKLYFNLQGSFSMIDQEAKHANRTINSLTLTPRFENKWLSFYLPVGIRQYDGLVMGAGLRLGPLSVGSGSLISNYLMDSSQTTDVYVGLKIPFFR